MSQKHLGVLYDRLSPVPILHCRQARGDLLESIGAGRSLSREQGLIDLVRLWHLGVKVGGYARHFHEHLRVVEVAAHCRVPVYVELRHHL